MGIFSRLKDLGRANINDLVTKAEDPEKSLNIYIEDAMEHLRQFTVEVNKFEAERIHIADHIRVCEALIKDWHEKAKLAVQQNQEDLARKALESERNETVRLEKLKADLKAAEKTSAQMKEQYQLLEQKVTEAKEHRDDLIRRSKSALAQKQAMDAMSNIGMDNPLSKFDRMKETVEQQEAEAEASFSMMTSSTDYQFDQLEKASQHLDVNDALEKLKQEMGK